MVSQFLTIKHSGVMNEYDIPILLMIFLLIVAFHSRFMKQEPGAEMVQ